MKKLMPISLMLALSFLIMLSCEEEQGRSEQESALTLTFEIPEKLISVDEAVNYYNNFYQTRILNQTSKSSGGTRTVWFDFEMLEDFFSKINTVSNEKSIEITKIVFLLSSDSSGNRTVMIAPATFDNGLGINRSFTVEDDRVVFLHGYPGDQYSELDSNFSEQVDLSNSLVLGNQGYLSSEEAITMYNRYYDLEVAPYTDQIEWDTRLVGYERGEFEGYLSYLKQNDIENDDIDISGINAIYGVYEDDPSNGAYANHVTLFFAPTDSNTDNQVSFSGFVPANSLSYDFTQNVLKLDSKFGQANSGSSGGSTYNHGNAGPPPPDDY